MKDKDARQLDKKTQKVIRRLAVAAVLVHEKTRSEVCELYKVSKQALSKWIKKFKKGGFPYLDSDRRGGKTQKPLLSGQQIRAIKNFIETKFPNELGLSYFLWTREAVQELIFEKYKIKVAPTTLSSYLGKWGFTPQKPAKKAREQNPELVKQWLEEEYPKIQKKAKAEKAEINWLDESGIQTNQNNLRSYAPKGKTPELPLQTKRVRANYISSITNKGKMKFMVYSGRFNSETLIQFLSRLIKGKERKQYIIMDNHPVHKSAAVKKWVEAHKEVIQIFYLPTYSPQLNPDEYLNGHLKKVIFKKEKPDNVQQLKVLILRVLKSIQSNINLVASYFDAKSVLYARA